MAIAVALMISVILRICSGVTLSRDTRAITAPCSLWKAPIISVIGRVGNFFPHLPAGQRGSFMRFSLAWRNCIPSGVTE